MSTSIGIAVAVAWLVSPPLTHVPVVGVGNTGAMVGRGSVPVRGPGPSSRSSADAATCAGDHPAAPHVHTNGRWVGHDSRPENPRELPASSTDHFAGRTGGRHVYVLRGRPERFDAGGGSFRVAPAEHDFCGNWVWEGESIAIYEDPVHDKRYLAYNVRTGTFVHVQYLGQSRVDGVAVPKKSLLTRFVLFWIHEASYLRFTR